MGHGMRAAWSLSAAIGAFTSAAPGQPADAWVILPGSNDRVAEWTQGGRSMQAIRLGDGRAASGPISHRVLLRYAQFDPLAGEPAVPATLRADAASRLAIIQFTTQFIESHALALAARGVRLRWSVGEHTFVAELAPADRPAVAALPFVRWIGDMHPAYKLEEPLLAMLAGDAGRGEARYSVLLLEQGHASKRRAAAAIEALGGRADKAEGDGLVIEATLTPDQLLKAARLDEVLWIDRAFAPTLYMDNVRVVGGANNLESVAGFTGAGVRAEVMDSELRTTHNDFQRNPPIRHGPVGSASQSHGTSVFGIVFGTGTVNPAGRGMLPDAQGIFASYTSFGNRYTHTAQLLQPPYEAVFQTNSWGSCCTTAYGSQAADADNMLFQNRITLLQAQANNGNTSSDVIAFAKNLVSVGAVRHYNTLTLADDAHLGTSGSTGPATDGRIKPDLCFWYDSIFTTSSSSNTSYTSSFGGTSAATPTTAGHFGLMFQMWNAGIFGNPVNPGGTVFSNRPAMSTAKALMINSASPYPFAGQAADLRRVRQGWGRPDVSRLYAARAAMFVVNETDPLLNLERRAYDVVVAPATPELRATMVYTDPAGIPNSTRHRVNDLDLKVTSPAGVVYWGNNGLLDANASTPGGSPNTVDTVENVWVTAPSPGTWTAEVIASELVQDARPQSPALDADFALVVSGASRCVADWNADGVVDFNDFLAYLNDFNAGAPRADLNADGVVDFNDLLLFLNRYNAAC
ncbi:MAG: peptidase S8 [Phycisphaerae bacterium]|nr:peptidase S8 [Phycisphaerae bacterium]